MYYDEISFTKTFHLAKKLLILAKRSGFVNKNIMHPNRLASRTLRYLKYPNPIFRTSQRTRTSHLKKTKFIIHNSKLITIFMISK